MVTISCALLPTSLAPISYIGSLNTQSNLRILSTSICTCNSVIKISTIKNVKAYLSEAASERMELVMLVFLSFCSGVDTLSCFISSLDSATEGGRLLLSSLLISFNDLMLRFSLLCGENGELATSSYVHIRKNDQLS